MVRPPEFEPGLENHLKLWFESPVRNLLSDVTKRLRNKVLSLKRYEVAEKILFEER